MPLQNLHNLPSIPLSGRINLPECVAIYFAINADECLYIGQTRNLRKRWQQQHHRFDELSKWDNVRIAWISVSEPDILDDLEIALIRHFKPRLNRRYIEHDRILVKQSAQPVDTHLEYLRQRLEKPNITQMRDEDYDPVTCQMAKFRGRSVAEYTQQSCELVTEYGHQMPNQVPFEGLRARYPRASDEQIREIMLLFSRSDLEMIVSQSNIK